MSKANPTAGFRGSYRVLETYPATDLIWLYKSKLSIDVSELYRGIEHIELVQCSKSGIKFFTPSITGDSSFYEKLQQVKHYYPKERPDFETAAAYAQGKRVLEIGSGPGFFSTKAEPSEYTGLELNPSAVAEAKKQGINVIQQNLEDYAHSAEKDYELVCCFQVLEHLADIESFFRNAIKLTAPGGRLIVSVPADDSFIGMASNHVLNLPPHHVSLWPDRSFTFLAQWFQLSLDELKHEEMEDIHKQWFFKVASQHRLRMILGAKHTKIDRTMKGQILDIAASLISYPLAFWLQDSAFFPAGHTVTAIYHKPRT